MLRFVDCGIAAQEDAYWSHAYRQAPYLRPGRDYEDYAPAYCVGYCGYAQYGGSFADAERCLGANWLRIKGDSRLDWDEARLAISAAWQRAEAQASPAYDWRSKPAHSMPCPMRAAPLSQGLATA